MGERERENLKQTPHPAQSPSQESRCLKDSATQAPCFSDTFISYPMTNACAGCWGYGGELGRCGVFRNKFVVAGIQNIWGKYQEIRLEMSA